MLCSAKQKLKNDDCAPYSPRSEGERLVRNSWPAFSTAIGFKKKPVDIVEAALEAFDVGLRPRWGHSLLQ